MGWLSGLGSLLGGGGIGTAAGDIVRTLRKRGDIAAQADGDEKRNRSTLPLIEALGTLRQRNARPDFLYLLGGLLRWYLLMPILAELYHVVTPRWRHCPEDDLGCVALLGTFDWLLIWETTGLPFMALVGAFVNVYAIGRTAEKVQGGASPGQAIFEGYSETLGEFGGAVIGRRPGSRETMRDPLDASAPITRRLDGIVVPEREAAVVPFDESRFRDMLIRDEGVRYETYPDYVLSKEAGRPVAWTGGVGHLLRPSEEGYGGPAITLSKEQVATWLKQDMAHALSEIRAVVPDFDALPDRARMVLANMEYQLKYQGVGDFVDMLAAIARRDWMAAAAEARDSKAYRQTPERWERHAQTFESLASGAALA